MVKIPQRASVLIEISEFRARFRRSRYMTTKFFSHIEWCPMNPALKRYSKSAYDNAANHAGAVDQESSNKLRKTEIVLLRENGVLL